jgi:hypothetical protein
MRGQRAFNEIMKGSGIDMTLRKGRNNTLVVMRNECLLARYYYYGYIKNKSYEETVKCLVAEFFLSAATIAIIIMEHTEQVQQLKQKAPVMFYFQTKWPQFKW